MKVGQLFNRLRGSRFVRVPELNDMSIDELRAWYDARERNHFLINVLFHAVVGVFTAGLFHFIWFAIARPAMQTPTWRRQHPPKVHPNILMLIKPFNAVRELITTVKEQIDNYQTPRERRVGSFDAGNQEEEIIEIPRWDEAVVSPAMTHKDVRSLWWSRLDDETLITTFIRPVDKKSRQLALHELFSRRSNSAVAYRNNYFRYYISHNLMKQQALSASYLKSLSTNFPDDERLFVFTITALAQLDQEHPAYANHIINSFYGHHSGDYSKPSINCDNFLCSVALNEFSIAHYNAKDPKHDAAIRAVAGDMSKIHESLHEKVFGGFFRGQGNTWVKNYHQFKVEEWDPVYQEKLLNRILEFLSTSAYSYRDTYKNLEHINFDLFDKNILTDFVHQLTSNMSLQNLTKSFKNSRETEKITALGVVLHSCTDPDILETIFTPLLKELHKPQDNWKKLRYLHALSKTNFANLPEDLKPRFIDFLCDEVNIQLENHNPKEMISLTIANLDFALINKKDQQRLIKAVQNSSRPLALLWATHFDHIDRGLYQQYIFDVMDFNSDNFAQTIRSKGNSCLKHIKPEAQNQLAEVALDDDKCGDFDIDINKATFFTQLDIRCLSKEIRQSICKIFVEFIIIFMDHDFSEHSQMHLYRSIQYKMPMLNDMEDKDYQRLLKYLLQYKDNITDEKTWNQISHIIRTLKLIPARFINADFEFFDFLFNLVEVQGRQNYDSRVNSIKLLRRYDSVIFSKLHLTRNYLQALLAATVYYGNNVDTGKDVRRSAIESLTSLPRDILSKHQDLVFNILIESISQYDGYRLDSILQNVTDLLPHLFTIFSEDKKEGMKQFILEKISKRSPLFYKIFACIKNDLAEEERSILDSSYFGKTDSSGLGRDYKTRLLPYFWFEASREQKAELFPEAAEELRNSL